MLFSSNKSVPIWILVAIALHNGCHLKGVYKYQRYERPKDRWDFKVFDLRTPIRSSSRASLVQQHVINLKIKFFGQTTGQRWNNNTTSFDSFDAFEQFSNETSRVGVSIINTDESDDEPYLYNNRLHQPLSKKIPLQDLLSRRLRVRSDFHRRGQPLGFYAHQLPDRYHHENPPRVGKPLLCLWIAHGNFGNRHGAKHAVFPL